MRLPERNHDFEEPEYVLVFLELIPIQPADFVILIVRIVISELRIQELVAGAEHRNYVREHEEAEEVLSLFPATFQNFRRHALLPFVSAAPTVTRVHTVLVCMTIFPIVFLIVGNQIVEREAVMAIDIVHGLESMIGMFAAVRKQIIAAIETTHKIWDHPLVAPHKTTDVITITLCPVQ